jgi:hypothetical protein
MNAIAAYFSGEKTFDDRLSPVLVKELRQGMRARIFVLSFLLVQIFLVVLTLGNLAAQDDRGTLDSQNGFFWTILGFALLVLTPLRGVASMSQEVKNRTLETIMLTRLTAWRVVAGKWSALFAQSLLLVAAVLPYVVVRYFIGGEDVVEDFKWIVLMLWLSGLLSAASIAVSGLANPLFRVIVFIGLIIVGSTGLENVVSFGLGRADFLEIAGWLIIIGFFIPALLFEVTASGIAPPSENHAVRRRVLAVLFLIAAAAWEEVTRRDFLPGMTLAVVVLASVCYFELAERPRLLSRMAEDFARRGTFGRIAGLFLLPGWPSGLLFCLLVLPAAIVFYQVAFLRPIENDNCLFLIFGVLGSILVPVCLCRFVWKNAKQVMLVAVLYNLGLGAVASICEAFQMLVHADTTLILAALPGLPTFWLLAINDSSVSFMADKGWYLLGNGCVVVFIILVLFIESRGYFRQLFQFYRSGNQPAAPVGDAEAAG